VSCDDPGGKGKSLLEMRRHIEPWLTALFQSEHLSLLAGSGLTHGVHFIANGKQAADMSSAVTAGKYADNIKREAKKSAEAAGRQTPNFEDELRVANELLRGLDILGGGDDTDNLWRDIRDALANLGVNVLKSERNIVTAGQSSKEAWNTLVTFLMSFASRTGTRDRLNIFTTNYDRLIEAGADLAGLHLLDRFVGKLAPVFRSSRLDLDMHYNPPGIRGEPRYLEGVARFTKLHGSLDWVQVEDQILRMGLPFGAAEIRPYFRFPVSEFPSTFDLMIYPNSAKDSETANYPFVELFRDFASAICRPNSTLVTYGYSFGDEHINRVIRDALTIPSTHLVVISYGDPLGRIMNMYKDLKRDSQITLLIGKDVANLKTLTENFLPKAAIDKTTSRMNDLLKQRYYEPVHSDGHKSSDEEQK